METILHQQHAVGVNLVTCVGYAFVFQILFTLDVFNHQYHKQSHDSYQL